MIKHYIVDIFIPYMAGNGKDYKHVAYVTAAGKRLAIKKFLFHMNADKEFSTFDIPVDIQLRHYNEMPNVYTDKLRRFRITIKLLGVHDDFVDLTDILG